MQGVEVQCPVCKGLCVIGTSVGGNPWRGRTIDCDTCHGLGYIKLFAGTLSDDQDSARAALGKE